MSHGSFNLMEVGLLAGLPTFGECGLPGLLGVVSSAGGVSWSEVFAVLLFRGGYNTAVVVAGTTMLGLAAGVVGVFAMLRKRALMSDALSHATLPGIAGVFIAVTMMGGEGRSLPVLLLGAAVTGVLGVLTVQAILRWTRLKEDAAIGIVLSVFFGVGIVLLSVVQKMATGNAAGLSHFIYGQTAAMRAGDAQLMAGLAVAAVLAAALLLKEFALVCFNDAFARVDGWPVTAVDLLMMALVVLVTVAGLQAVGLILVVAMLIIPPVAARFWTDRLGVLVVLSGVLGAVCGYVGAAVSALLPGYPAGAVIVLGAGVVFGVSMLFAPRRGVLATVWRRLRLRLQIAGEHLLEAAYEKSPRGDKGVDVATLPGAAVDAIALQRGWAWWLGPLVMLRLRRRGEASWTGNALRVNTRGLDSGQRVNRNHHLWEQYLVSYADIAPSHVDWSVDQVEHVLTPALVEELEGALEARGVVVPDGVESAGEK